MDIRPHKRLKTHVRQQIPKAKIPTNDQVTLRGSLSAIVRSDSSCFLIEWMDRSYTNHVQGHTNHVTNEVKSTITADS